MEIVISSPIYIRKSTTTISLEEYRKKREQRRRRVAKRQYKRFPLFAVEFMQSEFPEYTSEAFVEDITRRTKKTKSKRKVKSPITRQGRYPLMKDALLKYDESKDIEYLYQAQRLRNNMFLPFEIEFKLGKFKKLYTLPSTTSIKFIDSLGNIKFESWDELDNILKDKFRYHHCS